MAATSPTKDFYTALQRAYDYFNKHLFDGGLPDCLITVQREKNSMGFFSANRWVNPDNSTTHEIAVNPGYFAIYPLIEIFQTLVHEQVHLWQHEFGKPSRKVITTRNGPIKWNPLGLCQAIPESLEESA